MADAWTTLFDNSSLDSGDAWEHLLAQEGGGGVSDVRYISENGLVFLIEPEPIAFNSNTTQLSFDITPSYIDFILTEIEELNLEESEVLW